VSQQIHLLPLDSISPSKFDDPDSEERTLYVRYWQKKLENNKEISFPEDLVKEVVDTTKRFSFAYLKEALYACSISLILFIFIRVLFQRFHACYVGDS
jgi:hypothetical protein